MADTRRCQALELVRELDLPQCYIAAGFVRNAVWDNLHKKQDTPLNDVDVVYFDPDETNTKANEEHEAFLSLAMPELQWQVKNQAVMHLRNGDTPYLSTRDAMGYWPEKETAVAIRKRQDGRYELISAFGIESLLEGKISHNPRRDKGVFRRRIEQKGWLTVWPRLRVVEEKA